MIGRDTLEKLKIHLPPLEVQQNIVELAELADREQRLISKLIQKKKSVVSQILMNQAKTQGETP
jgi:restriction endonuclease S subunit